MKHLFSTQRNLKKLEKLPELGISKKTFFWIKNQLLLNTQSSRNILQYNITKIAQKLHEYKYLFDFPEWSKYLGIFVTSGPSQS